MLTPRVKSFLIWVAIPLGASALVLTHRDRVWFFYDEWGLIERILHAHGNLGAAFEPFNGHLWLFPYFIYRAQIDLFGLTSHLPVYVVFTMGLVALSVAAGLTLRTLGVPALAAAVGGVAITYFGTGAQSMVFAVILSANAALLFVLAAGLVGLRSQAQPRSAIAIALLLLVATAFDSGVTLVAGTYVVVIVATRWRDHAAWIGVALGPPAIAGLAWVLRAGTSGEIDKPLSWQGRLEVAGRLFLRSVGGFAGGTEVAGAVILVVATVIIVPAIIAGRLRGRPLLGLVAGGIAAGTITLAVASTRGGIVGADFFDFNRYLSQIALFAFIALVPAVLAAIPLTASRNDPRVTIITTSVFALMLVANLSPLSHYRAAFEKWNRQTHERVVQSLTVLDRGCPAGTHVDRRAQPVGTLSPQVTVRVLEDARARGLFDFDPVASVDPAIVDRISAKNEPRPAL